MLSIYITSKINSKKYLSNPDHVLGENTLSFFFAGKKNSVP